MMVLLKLARLHWVRKYSYNKIYSAKPDDLIISNINAVNKAICILPEGMSELLISPAFMVLRLKKQYIGLVDPVYIWSLLRQPAVVAEWLSSRLLKNAHLSV